MTKKYKAFYDEHGNLKRSYRWRSYDDAQTGVEINSWYDRLQIVQTRYYFVLKSLLTGKTYPMFQTDLFKEIKHLKNGVLEGVFSIRKSGYHFGVYLEFPLDVKDLASRM